MTKAEIQIQILSESNDAFKSLVQRLDLIPVSNPSFDSKVSAKVQELASTSKLLPRYIHTSNIFQTQADISRYLQSIIPAPWTYPLTTAPF